VQPSDAQHIKLLYIKSDLHDNISYKISDDATKPIADAVHNLPKASFVKLDTDHLVNSGELISAIGMAPKYLRFANSNADKDAKIEIFVLRNALATHI
jgi:hypothetical protein